MVTVALHNIRIVSCDNSTVHISLRTDEQQALFEKTLHLGGEIEVVTIDFVSPPLPVDRYTVKQLARVRFFFCALLTQAMQCLTS